MAKSLDRDSSRSKPKDFSQTETSVAALNGYMREDGSSPQRDSAERIYSIDFARERFLGNVSRSKLYAERKAGRIRFVRIGTRSFVTDAEIRRYISALFTVS